MKRHQSLLLQKLDIRIPHLHLRQLAVHQHLPETTSLQPHAHGFAQCLVYLTGQGHQQIEDAIHKVQAGTAVFLPAHVRHAFLRQANRRPICLVLDFDWRGASRLSPRVAVLPALVFHQVQQQVAELGQRRRRPDPGPALQTSALLLRLLDLLLGGLRLKESALAGMASPMQRRVEQVLGQQDAVNLAVHELARRAGYQSDYLNRRLKHETGLTVGRLRSLQQLTRARLRLRESGAIGDVAATLGFTDANYFARWFRRHTGMTPTQWRRAEATQLR